MRSCEKTVRPVFIHHCSAAATLPHSVEHGPQNFKSFPSLAAASHWCKKLYCGPPKNSRTLVSGYNSTGDHHAYCRVANKTGGCGCAAGPVDPDSNAAECSTHDAQYRHHGCPQRPCPTEDKKEGKQRGSHRRKCNQPTVHATGPLGCFHCYGTNVTPFPLFPPYSYPFLVASKALPPTGPSTGRTPDPFAVLTQAKCTTLGKIATKCGVRNDCGPSAGKKARRRPLLRLCWR